MAQPFLGEIKMFGGNFAPIGYAVCNGQLLAISQNAALFSLLGTNFGGNGTSNFGLPNLQGSAALGAGNGPGLTPRSLGETGGETAVTLLTTQIPAHNHTVNCLSANGNSQTPVGNVWAKVASGRGSLNLYGTTSPVAMSTAAIATAGGSQPHNNMPRYLVVTFIIALQGIYPTRN